MSMQSKFLVRWIESCYTFLEIMTDSTKGELYRNIRNALVYIFNGDEEALGLITEPGFINKAVLEDVLMYASAIGLDEQLYTAERLDVLSEYL